MTEPEVATPTPDETLEAAEAPSPEEQAPEAVENQSADTDAPAQPDPRIAQAEYTRAQQAFAEAKKLVGLDKKATREQFLEALAARLTAAPEAAEDEQVEVDPRVAEAERRAWEAEYRMISAVWPDYADPAIEFANLARTADTTPQELVQAFAVAVESAVDRRLSGAPSAPPAEASEEEAEELEVGAPLEDQAPSGSAEAQSEPAPYRRREPAVVGALRGIFREAGVGNQQ